MADLPSTFVKVNDVEVSPDAPVTENLHVKLGQNDNYLKDNLDAEITTRANADAVHTTSINTIISEVNQLVNVPMLIAQGTQSVGVALTTLRYVVAVFLYKDTSLAKSYLRIQVYDESSGNMDWDVIHDLGINPSAWATGAWFWNHTTQEVNWQMFSYVTVSA